MGSESRQHTQLSGLHTKHYIVVGARTAQVMVLPPESSNLLYHHVSFAHPPTFRPHECPCSWYINITLATCTVTERNLRPSKHYYHVCHETPYFHSHLSVLRRSAVVLRTPPDFRFAAA